MLGGLRRLIGHGRGDGGVKHRPQDPRVSGFMRGLTVGAFVGAVIAGSAIWNRRSHGG
jgi:hypothetical protein